MPGTLMSNRIEKARRFADAIEAGCASKGIDVADTLELLRVMGNAADGGAWPSVAATIGEKVPSHETQRLIVAILEERTSDPFRGLA